MNRITLAGLLATVATALAIPAAPAAAQTPDSVLAVSQSGNSLFRVNVDAGTTMGGVFGVGSIPVEGSGTRFLWYPAKAAIRAGTIDGTQWDDANIGLYSVAMGRSVRASGDNGVAMGIRSTAANASSLAIGEDNTATGFASVALGYHAHTNARRGSFVFSDDSSVDTTKAESQRQATFRVACGFKIYTSSNLSTGVAFGGSSVSNLGTACPTSYFGQSGTMIATSTGAYLSSGGTWTNASDVNRKHLFAAVSGEDVLSRLRAMDIQSWSYRTEDDEIRHIGPTAQDFRAAFGLGKDEISIATVDADGVALAGVKALEARTTTQSERIERLERENAELRAQLAALAEQVARLAPTRQ
jgi:hypothetical protein